MVKDMKLREESIPKEIGSGEDETPEARTTEVNHECYICKDTRQRFVHSEGKREGNS